MPDVSDKAKASFILRNALHTGSGIGVGGRSRFVADDVDDVVECGGDAAEKSSLGISHGSEQFGRALSHP